MSPPARVWNPASRRRRVQLLSLLRTSPSSYPDSWRKLVKDRSPYERNSATICFQFVLSCLLMFARTISCACLSSTICEPAGRNGKPCST